VFLTIGEVNSVDVSLNGMERSSMQLHLLLNPWPGELEDNG